MPDVPGPSPLRRDLSVSPLTPPLQRENGFDAAHSTGLFVGVGQFTIDRNLAPIPYAVDDAVDLAWTFAAELHLIPFEQVILCLGGAPRKPESAERLERLREAGATCHGGSRTEIGLAIVEFADMARPDGLMVATVSTHGFEVGGAHYFLATDSARRIATTSAIPFAELKGGLMRPADVRRRLLLIDTCRERLDSGEVKRIGGGLNPSLAAEMGKAEGFAALFATEMGKAEGFAALFATVAEGYSYDDPVAQNGVFTSGVLKGLRGAAPTDDTGFLRVGALAGYVDQHVRAWIRANNPHVGHPPGITRNLESDAEHLPLAFDEGKWTARRVADEEARRRADESAREQAEAEAYRRAAQEAQARAAAAERQAAEAALTERIRLARLRIGAAAAHDDAIADLLPAVTAALRDWPQDRRERLLTEIEALDPENPRLRYYFHTVAWKELSSTTRPPLVLPASEPAVSTSKPVPPTVVPPAVPVPTVQPPSRTIESAISRPGAKAGDRATITVNGVEFAFRWCPPGDFIMGSPSGLFGIGGESGRDKNEGPQTRVTLTKGFWMSETSVTQAQWKAIMGTTVAQQRDKADLSWPLRGQGWNYPMYYVSWSEIMGEQPSGKPVPTAASFLGRLNAASGESFALPTEAQWEYACRAGTATRFAFGDSDSMLGDYAWYDDNANITTHPVGGKRANGWGLHDMHGNLWEWCLDWYADSLPGGSVTDPTGPIKGTFRVFRGGSWGDWPSLARSARRSRYAPDYRSSFLGFRFVSPQ
ncbi:SUMF1/EgtB/PvdO family nonheme iron enzyme [bacterium]|nr:SUMF1/EgtB/PvdO family nonheme iron enzyme [bacterium]